MLCWVGAVFEIPLLAGTPQATLPCWTPIPAPPAGHARGSLPHPAIQDLASRGWEEPKPSFTLSLQPVSACWAKVKILDIQSPYKKSLFLWTCLYEASFVCTQTHVYKQLSTDYHSNEGIFRIFTTKFFFSKWQSDFSSYQQRT